MAYTLRVRDHATILGYDKDGQPITLGGYRADMDRQVDTILAGNSPTTFDEETWGRTPADLQSQQNLMSFLGNAGLELAKPEGELEG